MKKIFFIGLGLGLLFTLSPKTFAATQEASLTSLRTKIQSTDSLCTSRKAECLASIDKQLATPTESNSLVIKQCIQEMKAGYITSLENKIQELKTKIRALENTHADTEELKKVVKAAERKLQDLKML